MSDLLRLHTDTEGKVWCGYKDVCSHPTNLSVSDFVNTSTFKSAKQVRCLGTAQNATLITQAHQAIKRRESQGGTFSSLEVGSPQICPVRALRDDPAYCLMRIWQSDSQARLLHHWHPVDSFIFNSYLLVDAVKNSPEKAKVVFKHHPAFFSVSFVGTSNLDLAMQLVAKIVDPRWFWNEDKPHRLSKLYRFLGLIPSNFKNLDNFKEFSSMSDLENPLVVDSSFLTALAWSTREVDSVNYSLPENFLWRIYRENNFSCNGLLKASRNFVQFVTYNWLDNITFRKSMFDAGSFFKTQNEVLAYKAYEGQSQKQG